MIYQIVKIVSNTYTVENNKKRIDCTARGVFKNKKITPLVGDLCKIDLNNKQIIEILHRKNQLKRPNVSNIDYAIIVSSVKKPDLSLNLIDKMISSIILNNIEPIIYFSKMDLLNNKEKRYIKSIAKYYKKLNIKVVFNNKLFKLKRILKNKIAILCGQTGAGKSSLLNKLDKSLNLKTNEISLSLNRGVHTTTHTELYHVSNFLLADTPGFSSLDLSEYTKEQIRDSFIEFNKMECSYKDCMHKNERICAIKDSVNKNKILKSRYDNYLKFIEEAKK